jgi:hypothetical protein
MFVEPMLLRRLVIDIGCNIVCADWLLRLIIYMLMSPNCNDMLCVQVMCHRYNGMFVEPMMLQRLKIYIGCNVICADCENWLPRVIFYMLKCQNWLLRELFLHVEMSKLTIMCNILRVHSPNCNEMLCVHVMCHRYNAMLTLWAPNIPCLKKPQL